MKRDRYVYFIQRGGVDGPIKVGISDNPQSRLEQLQGAHFEILYLIGTTSGSVMTEREIHEQLSEYSLGREWYSPCEALFDLIEKRTPNLSRSVGAAKLAREHLREAISYFSLHAIDEAGRELSRASELIEESINHLVTDEAAT